MFKTIYYKYFFIILLGIAATHLLFSYSLGFLTSFFYRDSLINIRNYPGKEYQSISHAYLSSSLAAAKKPVILVLGTSFSYGYDLTKKDTFSYLLSQQFPQYSMMNAAVISENTQGILEKLYYLVNSRLKVDTLIIEINIFNLLTDNLLVDSETILKRSKLRFPDSITNNFFLFYLFHPHGLDTIVNLDLNRIYVLGPKDGHPFNFSALPDSYAKSYSEFRKEFPKYKKEILDILTSAQKVATNVYFFIAPIYGSGIKKTQFPLADIEKEVADLNEICSNFPKIHCLNPGIQYSESYFMNVSHYNEEGHRYLARWLGKKLKNLRG